LYYQLKLYFSFHDLRLASMLTAHKSVFELDSSRCDLTLFSRTSPKEWTCY